MPEDFDGLPVANLQNSWLFPYEKDRDPEHIPLLTNQTFSRVQFHRNNRAYRFLIHACRLVHQCLLPEERDGSRRFRDILRDETVMSALFEQFVLNFARRHCRGAGVSAMEIKWRAEYEGDAREVEHALGLPPGIIRRVERRGNPRCNSRLDAGRA